MCASLMNYAVWLNFEEFLDPDISDIMYHDCFITS